MTAVRGHHAIAGAFLRQMNRSEFKFWQWTTVHICENSATLANASFHGATQHSHLQVGAVPLHVPSVLHSRSAWPSSEWPLGQSYCIFSPKVNFLPNTVVFCCASGEPHDKGAVEGTKAERYSWHTRLMATYSADRWSADSPGCSPRRSTANCVRHRRRHSSALRCSCSAGPCPRQAFALFHLCNELQYICIYV